MEVCINWTQTLGSSKHDAEPLTEPSWLAQIIVGVPIQVHPIETIFSATP